MLTGERTRTGLETPLNWIFASEANVKIVRELVLARSPLSKAELARRTGVSLPGVLKAVVRLFDTGLVEAIGTGGRQVLAIREAHPLRGALDLLFATEALHQHQLEADVARVIGEADPPVRSAWLDESGRDRPSAPVGLHVLVSSGDVRAAQDALRPRLAKLSARFGVLLELHVRTAPDVAALRAEERERLKNVVPLHGLNPVLLLRDPQAVPKRTRTVRIHLAREAQSLKRASWIVRLLDRDPALPKRASRWIVHRMHTASEREVADLQEWLDLLQSAPIATLQYVLLRVDERSDRLRQTNPFIMVLSHEERIRMVEETAE
jgi:DNA-binding Lrp family transcriptional regulator